METYWKSIFRVIFHGILNRFLIYGYDSIAHKTVTFLLMPSPISSLWSRYETEKQVVNAISRPILEFLSKLSPQPLKPIKPTANSLKTDQTSPTMVFMPIVSSIKKKQGDWNELCINHRESWSIIVILLRMVSPWMEKEFQIYDSAVCEINGFNNVE